MTHKLIRYFQITALIFYCLQAGNINAVAQAAPSEYQIKAAFLYKFASYIEWPVDSFSDDSSQLIFGVIGADLLADNLEQIIKGRKIQDRDILVRRLRTGDSFAGLHVLFVGDSSITTLEPVLMEAASMSVLTVTETASPRSSGSVINFEVIDDKVRFDVLLKLAEQGKLKISSRLLQVAYKVIDG